MLARSLAFALLATGTLAAENVIKLPVQVDQAGKTIYFVTNADSDVLAEALQFCEAHMKHVDVMSCAEKLESQVAVIRNERETAAAQIPGLSFTVNNAAGETIRFVCTDHISCC